MNVKISDTQKILFLVSAVIFFYIVYILAPILTPFLVAGVFAYLGDPIVDKLEDLRFTRTASVFVVFLIFIILILSFVFIIFPLIQNQIRLGLMRMERVVKERMTTQLDPDQTIPATLINIRPVVASIREIYGGKS